jgi:DNA-binding response OmpR family regulator
VRHTGGWYALKKILLISGDPDLGKSVAQALGNGQFKVIVPADTTRMMMTLYETYPDMVIIDENFPRLDIEQVFTQLRRISNIPIIVLTDKKDNPVAARFLEMGADSCLTKPFSLRLFLARVHSLLSRCRARPSYHLPQGIDLDCETHQVNLEGHIIKLTPTEFRFFSCLMLNEGRIVSYSELAMGVWGQEDWRSGSIKFYAHALRKKLHGKALQHFQPFNGRGIGFSFKPSSLLDDEKRSNRVPITVTSNQALKEIFI